MAKNNNVPNPSEFKGGDQSDNLANANQVIEFYHIPSGKSVRFKAYVTAFEDQYSSNWETTNTYGRMDPVATFQNTQRQISIAFDVPANSLLEAGNNLSRISSLIQFTYPTYESGDFGASTISSSPLLKMSFMNWVKKDNEADLVLPASNAESDGLIGFLGGVNYTPDMEQGVFYGNQGAIYPKLYRLNLNYTVIHSKKLGFGRGGEPFDDRFPYSAPQSYAIEKAAPLAAKAVEEKNKQFSANFLAERRRITGGPSSKAEDSYAAAEFRKRERLANVDLDKFWEEGE